MHIWPFVLQSVSRAEIFAASMALSHGVPPLVLHTDNSTVYRGLRRGRAWCTSANRSHADLWVRIWNMIDDLGGYCDSGVLGCKVKAHRTKKDTEAFSLTDARHTLGNEVADSCAKAGARAHNHAPETISKYIAAHTLVTDVLSFAARILVVAVDVHTPYWVCAYVNFIKLGLYFR